MSAPNTNTKPPATKAPMKKTVVPRPNKISRTDVDDANRAAEGFLQLYYDCIDGPARDANIVDLYQDASTISWNGEQVTGKEKIKEFFLKMPQSTHEIQSWDCHPIPGHTPAPLLITVSGTVTHGPTPPKIPPTKNPAVLPRIFAQTFVIAPETGVVAVQDQAPVLPAAVLSGSTGTKPGEDETFYVRADTYRFVG